MDNFERELRYLAIEAHETKQFIEQVRDKSPTSPVVVPNLSYGLVAISPVLHQLRAECQIAPFKIGSTESHNNGEIIGSRCIPLEALIRPSHQSPVIIVDGTRNTGGSGRAYNKYPDSQQGYLNYVAVLNDAISAGKEGDFIDMMGISKEHVASLRRTSQYKQERKAIDNALDGAGDIQPYAFKYWNPAELKLAIYNHGEGCSESVDCAKLDGKNSVDPTVFFVNAVIPDKYHSRKHREEWGSHTPAHFDDDSIAERAAFCWDKHGVFVTSGVGQKAKRIYAELYENGDGK